MTSTVRRITSEVPVGPAIGGQCWPIAGRSVIRSRRGRSSRFRRCRTSGTVRQKVSAGPGRTVSVVNQPVAPEALLISGTVGAGKTTAADAVGDWLRAHGIPHAVVDLDWLRASWPTAPADPFGLSIELRNLTMVAANYLLDGAHRLVLAGVLEDPAMRDRYRHAVDVSLQVARLRIDLSLVQRRLRNRHAGQQTALDWHLDRSEELHLILESVALEDFVVDVDELSIEQTAAALVRGAGWETTSQP